MGDNPGGDRVDTGRLSSKGVKCCAAGPSGFIEASAIDSGVTDSPADCQKVGSMPPPRRALDRRRAFIEPRRNRALGSFRQILNCVHGQ